VKSLGEVRPEWRLTDAQLTPFGEAHAGLADLERALKSGLRFPTGLSARFVEAEVLRLSQNLENTGSHDDELRRFRFLLADEFDQVRNPLPPLAACAGDVKLDDKQMKQCARACVLGIESLRFDRPENDIDPRHDSLLGFTSLCDRLQREMKSMVEGLRDADAAGGGISFDATRQRAQRLCGLLDRLLNPQLRLNTWFEDRPVPEEWPTSATAGLLDVRTKLHHAAQGFPPNSCCVIA
jgi:hypothetical protein